jgi:hypothetical protein
MQENVQKEMSQPQKLDEMDLLKLITIYEQERRILAEERELQTRQRQIKYDHEDNATRKQQIYLELHDKYNLLSDAYINFETGEIASKLPPETIAKI